jgi:hypothetical protein
MHAALGALGLTIENCDAVASFLAQRNEDAADRVLAIQ